MRTRIVLTDILRDNDQFLVVKRNENDEFDPIVTHYYDEVKEKKGN